MSANFSYKFDIYPEVEDQATPAKIEALNLKSVPGRYRTTSSSNHVFTRPVASFQPLPVSNQKLYPITTPFRDFKQPFTLPLTTDEHQAWFRVAENSKSITAESGFHNFRNNILTLFNPLLNTFYRSKLVWLLAGVLFGVITISLFSLIISSNNKPLDIYNFGIPANQLNQVTSNPDTTAPPVNTSTGTVEGKPSITVARIEQVLRQYNSPAVGSSQSLYDLGNRYGIDPAYALAFFIHESSAGTKGVAVTTKSLGNIRQTTNSGFDAYQGYRKYPSWEAGMEDWYKLISNLYIKGWGLKTVEKIIPKYAPAADNNNEASYINHVNSLVDTWRNTK